MREEVAREAGVGWAEVELRYGAGESCRRAVVRVEPRNEGHMVVSFCSLDPGELALEAHATLIPHVDRPLRLGTGEELALSGGERAWSGIDIGGWVEHAGWRLLVPPEARLHWPVLPFNPYRKDGQATVEEGGSS